MDIEFMTLLLNRKPVGDVTTLLETKGGFVLHITDLKGTFKMPITIMGGTNFTLSNNVFNALVQGTTGGVSRSSGTLAATIIGNLLAADGKKYLVNILYGSNEAPTAGPVHMHLYHNGKKHDLFHAILGTEH